MERKPNIPWVLPPDVQPEDMLYVADPELRIRFTNDEWSRFAGDNNGQRLRGGSWNPSVLENMSGKERARWTSIYRMLLDGKLPYHEEQFNCSSPAERRVYRLRITPGRDETGSIAWLVHHAVRLDEQQEQARAMATRLDRLSEDPQKAMALYRKHIERRIEIDGFRVFEDVQPLEDVGGDFLWHRRHAGGTTDLVHGDAMGHGLAAALFAAKVVVVLNEVSSPETGPSDTIARINLMLARATPADDVNFATGLLLRFHAARDQLTACPFGHDGVLFSRTGMISLATGPPVGLSESVAGWPETQIDLKEHGKRFLLFSDGIIEQFNERGERFGVERVLAIFRQTQSQPLERTLQAIHEAIEEFRGSAIVKDDRTLLALEYEG